MNFDFKENYDYSEFLKKIGKCQAEVYYETTDGDCLELHSAFCQFIFLDLVNQADAPKGHIRLADRKDLPVLDEFLEERK